jgi:hypothetical protein
VDAEPSNGRTELGHCVHAVFRSVKAVSRLPILYQRLQERRLHPISPIRRNGIAPSSSGEAALQILPKSFVEVNLKRFPGHFLIFSLAQSGVSQCANAIVRRLKSLPRDASM